MDKLKKIQAFICDKKKTDDLAIQEKTNMLRRQFKAQEQLAHHQRRQQESTAVNVPQSINTLQFLNLLNQEKSLNQTRRGRVSVIQGQLLKMAEIKEQPQKSQMKFRPVSQREHMSQSRKSLRESQILDSVVDALPSGQKSVPRIRNTSSYVGLSQSQQRPGSVQSRGDGGLQARVQQLKEQTQESQQHQMDQLDKQQEIEHSIGRYSQEINRLKESWRAMEYLLQNHESRFRESGVACAEAVKNMQHTRYNLGRTQTQLREKQAEEHHYISIISSENQNQKTQVQQKERGLSVMLHLVDEKNLVISSQMDSLARLKQQTLLIRSCRNQFDHLERQIHTLDLLDDLLLRGKLSAFYLTNPAQKVTVAMLKSLKHKNQMTNIFSRMKQSKSNELCLLSSRLISEFQQQDRQQTTLQNIYATSVLDKNKKEIELQALEKQLFFMERHIIADDQKVALIEHNEQALRGDLETLNLLKMEKSEQNFFVRQEMQTKISEAEKFIFYVILAIINQIIRFSLMISKMFDGNSPSDRLRLSIRSIVKKSSQKQSAKFVLQDLSRRFIKEYIQVNEDIKVLFPPSSYLFKEFSAGEFTSTQKQSVPFTESWNKLQEEKLESKTVQSIIQEEYGQSHPDVESVMRAIQQDHIVTLKVTSSLFTRFVKESCAKSSDVTLLKDELHSLKDSCYSLFQTQIESIFKDFCKIYFEIFMSYQNDLKKRIEEDPNFDQANLKPKEMTLKETRFVRDIANSTINRIIKQKGFDEEEFIKLKRGSGENSNESMQEMQLTPRQECITKLSSSSMIDQEIKDPQHEEEHKTSRANKMQSLKSVISRKIQKYKRINDLQPTEYEQPETFLKSQLSHFNHDQVMVQEVAKYKSLVAGMKHSDVTLLNQQLYFQKQKIINKTECNNLRHFEPSSPQPTPSPTRKLRNKSVSLTPRNLVAGRRNQSIVMNSFRSKQNLLSLDKNSLQCVSARKIMPSTTSNVSSSQRGKRGLLQTSCSSQKQLQRPIGILNQKIQIVKQINSKIQKDLGQKRKT